MDFFKTEKYWVNILKGIIISFMFTVIALTVFSIILVYTNLTESTIKPVIITITGISILIGSSIGTRNLKRKGLLNGAIIGSTYIISLYLISSGLNSNFRLNMVSIIMIFIRSYRRNYRRSYRNKYKITF